MRIKVTILPPVARVLAILAGLAGGGAGLLYSTFAAGFACFDSCPEQAFYLSWFPQATLKTMAPCIALAVLALLVYLGYCIATGHLRAMVLPVLVLVAGYVALVLFAQAGLAQLPASDGLLQEQPLVSWEAEWGLALMVVSAAWSALMAWQARVRPTTPVSTTVLR